MKVWYVPGGWECDDLMWFLKNFRMIYHLTCMFKDGME